MKSKNLKRMIVLVAFGLTYGFMYILPYMKYTFYDQMIAAMGCTNAQLGSLMTLYAIACTASYIPGGWIADKFSCKKVIIASTFGQGILCFVFIFVCQNFFAAQVIWFLCAFTGGFAFWPAMLKGIRLIGTKEEHGRLYGIFEGINGLASLLVSFLMIGVLAVFSDNLIMGFKGAVATMGVLCVLAGIILFFFYDENLTESESGDDDSEKINLGLVKEVIKMPVVWLVALMMFGQVFFTSGMSYLTPYSTEFLGLSLTLAATVGTLRTYGARFIGGPLGGVLGDKVFKSASKQQVLSFALCGIILSMFLILPGSTPSWVLVVLMIVIGIAFFMEKGPLYAVVSELRVKRAVTGTALALITLIGYLPDMFVHVIFGKWLDEYGRAGYSRIFLLTLVITVGCIICSLICVRLAKKYNKNAAAE